VTTKMTTSEIPGTSLSPFQKLFQALPDDEPRAFAILTFWRIRSCRGVGKAIRLQSKTAEPEGIIRFSF